MSTERSNSWDLAGRLIVTVDGLDVEQRDEVRAQLDPFVSVESRLDPDLVLGTLGSPDLVEVQGPAKDRQVTAIDREGRLLARFGSHWLQIPGPGDTPVRLNAQPGLALGACWREVVRPAMHQALRRRNAVAVHAAAVDGAGLGGTLICGWSESGKTEVALAMVEAGADFLSDKWTVLGVDGQISAFPVGIGVRGWALKSLPRLEASLPHRARAQLAAARLLRATASPVLNHDRGGRLVTLATGVLRHAIELGDRAGLSPTALRRSYQQADDPARRSELETVVVLVTGPSNQVTVEDAAPEWAAQRLARTAAYERRTYYDLQERGAYGDLPERSRARDAAIAEEASLLAAPLVKGTRVLRVTCPFPGDPRRVVEALAAHH